MKAIIAFCALLASNPVSAQQIHRWVDADGRVQYSDQPPPGVASKPVAVRINSYGGTPEVSGSVSPAASRPEIKMFATDWCPYCRRAQFFFARLGIRYTHIGVPLITVGTQRMTGFSEEGFAQLLKAAGY